MRATAALEFSNNYLSDRQEDKMTNNLISIENISVSFGGFVAIDDISLNVDKNELRVIIGPNGAGKTTLLDIICGKTKPTSGRIFFKGVDLTKAQPFEIVRMGVVRKFQTPSVYEDLTLRENFEISIPQGKGVIGSLFFKRATDSNQRVQEAAETVFLEDSLDIKAKYLSHGQKQWLEIGMMLIQNPEILLLDEPVAGMTQKEREQTAELLNRISVDRSIIVIEHDMDFVRNIARKVTVLHQGAVLREGTIDEVQNDSKVIEVYLGA